MFFLGRNFVSCLLCIPKSKNLKKTLKLFFIFFNTDLHATARNFVLMYSNDSGEQYLALNLIAS